MDRETKLIKTPLDGHEVVIKTWITGGEKRALLRPFSEGAEVNVKVGGETEVKTKDSAMMIEKAENALIETIIVSINGVKEDILKVVLGMKSQDCDFVLKEVNKVGSGKDFTKPESEQEKDTDSGN